jgi:hypothetical protein
MTHEADMLLLQGRKLAFEAADAGREYRHRRRM